MPASTRIRAVSVTAAIATALTLGVAGVAYASDDSGAENCVKSDGGGVLDVAANVLDVVAVNLNLLDGKDSVACAPRPAAHEEDPDPDDDPDDPSCDDFDSQADAQEALEDDEDLAKFLDRDGDGVACESLFDDNDPSNDDDDKKKSKDDDDEKSGGGQVKEYPKGGVDTGGFAA